LKNKSKGFFIGISLIFIISLFFISAVAASSITVTSKPSAKNNLAYKDYTVTWKNHCPLCGHDNTLIFNPKGTYEGELTCSKCGADYCSVTGKDKYGGGPRAYLEAFKVHEDVKDLTSNNNTDKNQTNETEDANLRKVILNGIKFDSYSQITATVLENII
jgi:hypothetical protein